jgi:hypothetical protein
MRQLMSHKLDHLNRLVKVEAYDDPFSVVCHKYVVSLPNNINVTLPFHVGTTVSPFRPNGLTNETLLAIVIDRVKSAQHNNQVCIDNQQALVHLEAALAWLHNGALLQQDKQAKELP